MKLSQPSLVGLKPISLLARPTSFPDVNAALERLVGDLQTILEGRLQGVYLIGSLALGGFDPQHSDLDLIVVTAAMPDDALVQRLTVMHQTLAASGLPWTDRLEVVYVPHDVLTVAGTPEVQVPQLEVGRRMFVEPLEAGWVSQRHTLKEVPLTEAEIDITLAFLAFTDAQARQPTRDGS